MKIIDETAPEEINLQQILKNIPEMSFQINPFFRLNAPATEKKIFRLKLRTMGKSIIRKKATIERKINKQEKDKGKIK